MHLERFYSASVLILSRPGAEDSRTVSEPGTERERLSSTSVNEPVSRGFLTLQDRMLFVLTMTAFWFHHANILRGQCTASGQASDVNSQATLLPAQGHSYSYSLRDSPSLPQESAQGYQTEFISMPARSLSENNTAI